MATNEELIQAAQLLKENCETRADCMACPFVRKGTVCNCTLTRPDTWQIPGTRRWTDTDILWAKAAKASGLVKIYKGLDSTAASGSAPGVDSCEFPWGAFKALKHDETVLIDDVLKEEN